MTNDEGAADGGEGSTADSMSARAEESSVKLWVLMEANRILLALAVLGVVFLSLVLILLGKQGAFEAAVQRGDPVQTLFQALVTAIVTGVSVVVSINSLVLSQELDPLGQQAEKMDEATAFRDEVATMTGAPASPADPAAFLQALLEETVRRAGELEDASSDLADEEAHAAISGYAADVESDAEGIADRIAGAEFGTFAVVSTALDFEYSRRIQEGKRLAGEYGDGVGEDVEGALEAVVEVLQRYGPSREHVKTLYFQWELVDLSRGVLYAAVPALVASVASILVLGDPSTVPGSTLGLSNQGWVVAAAATVALSPFAVLLSYILRVATVAKRTLAMGPFVLRSEGR